MFDMVDDCLIQQATIAKIDRPLAYNLKMLRRWLSHSTYGRSFLIGLEDETWDVKYDKDFIAIPRPASEVERDTLSQLFLGPVLETYHNLLGRFHKVRFQRILCRYKLIPIHVYRSLPQEIVMEIT